MSFRAGSVLERVGACCFADCAFEEFRAPESLRELYCGAFAGCARLKRVLLNEGLETFGYRGTCDDSERLSRDYEGVFWDSGVEELVLPRTLRKVSAAAFSGCDTLEIVWV